MGGKKIMEAEGIFMVDKKYQSWSFRRLMIVCIEKEDSPI